jgi:hypothetical protein
MMEGRMNCDYDDDDDDDDYDYDDDENDVLLHALQKVKFG